MLRKIILNSLYFSGLHLLAKPFTGGQGAVLMLHRVDDKPSDGFCPNNHLKISAKFLDRMITALAKSGYEFISLDAAAERMGSKSRGENDRPFLCMTLDDGYKDNYEFAVPIFRKHEVPYAIYIAPGLVDGTDTLWWEDIEHVISEREHIYVELPNGREGFDVATFEQKEMVFQQLAHDLLFVCTEEDQRRIVKRLTRDYEFDAVGHVKREIMDWSQIAELSRDPLCTIGAHTVGHHALAKMEEKDAHYEIVQSQKVIQREIGQKPVHFAYPYGHPELAGKREFETTKDAGFKTAVTTRHGVVTRYHSGHETALPRISINGNFQTVAYTKALLSGLPARLINRGRAINVD